jgi:hypothetical protein
LVSRADQTIDTEQIAAQWDRMGQLYASLKTGHVTASVALKRLVGFSAKNRFYRANRDLGRIFKTEFTTSWVSSCASCSGGSISNTVSTILRCLDVSSQRGGRQWHYYRPAWTPPSTRMFSPVFCRVRGYSDL